MHLIGNHHASVQRPATEVFDRQKLNGFFRQEVFGFAFRHKDFKGVVKRANVRRHLFIEIAWQEAKALLPGHIDNRLDIVDLIDFPLGELFACNIGGQEGLGCSRRSGK